MEGFSLKDTVINSSTPSYEYRSRGGERNHTVVNSRQRKLILSEIQFLTNYLSKGVYKPIVVYAGAAPGIHIRLLSSMFPDVEFHLYDPGEFQVSSGGNIKVYRAPFTNELAKKWSRDNYPNVDPSKEDKREWKAVPSRPGSDRPLSATVTTAATDLSTGTTSATITASSVTFGLTVGDKGTSPPPSDKSSSTSLSLLSSTDSTTSSTGSGIVRPLSATASPFFSTISSTTSTTAITSTTTTTSSTTAVSVQTTSSGTIVTEIEDIKEEKSQTHRPRSRVFFISDIRTLGPWLPPNHPNKDEVHAQDVKIEEAVLSDMHMQETWTKIMEPREAMLKFRPPYAYDWAPSTFYYLQGIVNIQAWPRLSSTETRLVPIRNNQGNYYSVVWNVKDYENKLAYHNAVRRENIKYINPFSNMMSPIDGRELTNDYDSMLEATILIAYMAKFLPKRVVQTDDGAVEEYGVTWKGVVALSRLITARLMRGRTIEDARREGEIMEEAKATHGDLRFNTHVVGMSKLVPGCVDYSKFRIVQGSWNYCLMPHQIQVVNSTLTALATKYLGGLDGVKLIVDGTGHIGCDTVNFANLFKKSQLMVAEIDTTAFGCLGENVATLLGDESGRLHLVQGDIVDIIDKGEWRSDMKIDPSTPIDIFYIDPPWGGSKYKDKEKINLFLGKGTAVDFAIKMIEKKDTKMVILKAPFNYDMALFAKRVYGTSLQKNVFVNPIWKIDPSGSVNTKEVSYYFIVFVSPYLVGK